MQARAFRHSAVRHDDAAESSVIDADGGACMSIAKSVLRAGPQRFTDFQSNALAHVLKPACETRRIVAKPRAQDDTFPIVEFGPVNGADHDLVVRLCQMPPSLAAPLLRSSLPALDTSALLAVVRNTGAAHHALIAARPGIDWRVVKAIIRGGHIDALRSLAANGTADFDSDDLAQLVEVAKSDPGLREALTIRAGRTPNSQTGRATRQSDLRLMRLIRAGDRSGALRELAKRLDIEKDALAIALANESVVPFALALCALGFDRAIFFDLLPAWAPSYAPLPQGRRAVIGAVFALDAPGARNRLMALLN